MNQGGRLVPLVEGLFGYRFGNGLDVGFALAFHPYPAGPRLEGVPVTPGSVQQLAFGPTLGYRQKLTESGLGLYTTVQLRAMLTHMHMDGEGSRYRLGNYGANAGVDLFRELKLGKRLSAFPSVGLFTQSFDEDMGGIATGLALKLPFAYRIGGQQVVLEPVLRYGNARRLGNFSFHDFRFDPGLGIRINF